MVQRDESKIVARAEDIVDMDSPSSGIKRSDTLVTSLRALLLLLVLLKLSLRNIQEYGWCQC